VQNPHPYRYPRTQIPIHTNSLSSSHVQNPYPILIVARKSLSSYTNPKIPILLARRSPYRVPILARKFENPYPHTRRKYAVFGENGRPLVVSTVSLSSPTVWYYHHFLEYFSSQFSFPTSLFLPSAKMQTESSWSERVVPEG